MTETEEWREIVGWEGFYEVSSFGRVRRVKREISCRDGRVRCSREGFLLLTPGRKGYIRIGLYGHGRAESRAVHSLVLGAFVGPRPINRFHIAHKDGNPTNNRLDNLRYATPTENALDRSRHRSDPNRSSRTMLAGAWPVQDGTPPVKGERWKAVLGWEGLYEVSSMGRVRSLDRIVFDTYRGTCRVRRFAGCLIKPQINFHGYPHLRLVRQGKSSTRKIYTLVADAFLGSRPPGTEVAHNDGNKLNSNSNNLRWATHAENISDMREHGTLLRGSRNPAAKLSDEQVTKIKSARDVTQRELASLFGVSRSLVGLIRQGHRRAA